jgi:hypothetical protein
VNNNSNYVYDEYLQEYVLIPSAVSNYKITTTCTRLMRLSAVVSKTSATKQGCGRKAPVMRRIIEYRDRFTNNYAIALFPSVFLSQKLNNKQDLSSATRGGSTGLISSS